MIFNSTKIVFFIMLILSTLITLSANNWLGMWMGLEINLMSFIPLISKTKNKKSSQAMMIYFLTQSIGSMVLLFSILIKFLIIINPLLNEEITKIMLMISIMIKVGIAPFHMWLPEMMSNLNWFESMLLMTWQKLAPLCVLSNSSPNNWFIYLATILSSTIGAIGGLNQTSLRKILAYSSINHLSWMIVFMSMSTSWYKYWLIYSVAILMLCIILSEKNIFFINQFNSCSPSMTEKFALVITLLSIGGLPPFIGFLPKWMVIMNMIESNLYMLLVFMLFMSLVTLFYYMRLVMYMVLSYSTMNKWVPYMSMNKLILYFIYLINLLLPVFSIINF
uniref:NADH dehydrogenase subunit 2 n=1 Tax=Melanacanthus marginatus TaxID=2924067 RepID=UPI001FA6E310|nr:NADH dehydrogenase subunit 2 [Melanacanthus marginatus]UMY75922.1 NADH dehydrogenase subunit 2 [Melanacanthus marginatus]